MSSPENIVYQDKQIGLIIGANPAGSAPALFERYRVSGTNKDAFVAALIARLCLLETQQALSKKVEP